MKPDHYLKQRLFAVQDPRLSIMTLSMLSGEAARWQGRWYMCVVFTCGVPGSHGDTHPHP